MYKDRKKKHIGKEICMIMHSSLRSYEDVFWFYYPLAGIGKDICREIAKKMMDAAKI